MGQSRFSVQNDKARLQVFNEVDEIIGMIKGIKRQILTSKCFFQKSRRKCIFIDPKNQIHAVYPLTKSAVGYYHRTMEKEKSKVMVRDIQTESILFECEIEDSEKAYQFAAQMEEMGLDIEVIVPTLTETLSTSLGLSTEQRKTYKESLDAEIEDHEGSCCFEKSDKNIVH